MGDSRLIPQRGLLLPTILHSFPSSFSFSSFFLLFLGMFYTVVLLVCCCLDFKILYLCYQTPPTPPPPHPRCFSDTVRTACAQRCIMGSAHALLSAE